MHPARGLLALAACCFGLCVIVDAQVRHRVTFDDLQTIAPLTQLTISPDGSWLAYVSKEELWIRRTRQATAARSLGGATDPLWAPDSKHLAYYVTVAGQTQLQVFDVTTLRSEQVTNLSGGISPDRATEFIGMQGSSHDSLRYSWSPDSTELVFSSQVLAGPSSVPHTDLNSIPLADGLPLVLTNTTPPDWTNSGLFAHGPGTFPHFVNGKWTEVTEEKPATAFNQLFIADINSKQTKQLTFDNSVYFTPDWLPDGRHIVCVSMEGRPLSGWGSGPTNLYLIDASTGKKRALTSDNLYKRIPHISPDGQWVAFGTEATPGDSFLSLIPTTGGTPINLTSALDRQPEEFQWSSDSKSLLFTFTDGRSRPLATVDVLTQRITPALKSPDEPAFRSAITVSRTGLISWIQSDGSSPARIYVLPPDSITPHVVVDPNPQVGTWELGLQQVVHWSNSHGEDLEGILIKPADYQEGHKYPLIVDCYPGTANSFHNSAMSGNQAWASKGYAVFWPAARAPHVWISPYKSRAFDQTAKGPAGLDIMFEDVTSGIDELIRQGLVDEKRIGLYGFSNGGAVAIQLLSKTPRFKCAVIVAPASSVDWTSKFFLNTLDNIIPYTVGELPWEDPNRYVRLSVVYRMDAVTTPTLLADGDADTEFLFSTIELYNGLRWLHRDVTLLRYPNQGHGFEGPSLRDFFGRAMAFFDKYLSPTS